ncbi:hypothetical protein VaNZ11_005464 [Volvox africanus]|uniref:Uncharacterized protein n=1 Tax=Volvox africanus TaxID=51714 RepID=A0ABQ5RYM8_9CHLO|nr:hypothetical protein VaNZ11_005464 [Volvox africanus]
MYVIRQAGLCTGDVEMAGRTEVPAKDMQSFLGETASLLEQLSECAGVMECQEAGPTVNRDSLEHSAISAEMNALVWTTRLRMVLSQTFGISEVRTELLDLVSLGVLYNDALAPLLLQQMVRSLERGSWAEPGTGSAGGSAGAYGCRRGGDEENDWGEPMREGPDDTGWDGEELNGRAGAGTVKRFQRSKAACQLLGPTIADLPLALHLYSSCPEKCGELALQVVATIALLSSPKELSSWFAAYSAGGLTQVMDWLLEATLGWLTGPLSTDAADYEDGVRDAASSGGIFLQRQRDSNDGAAERVMVSPVAAAEHDQFLPLVQCGAVLLTAMSWSCPAVARGALVVVLDRLGAADEDLEGELEGHDEPFSCAIDDVGFHRCGPVWHVLRAIMSDMARVLAVRDRLKVLMRTGYEVGGMGSPSALQGSWYDHGPGPMAGGIPNEEAVRLVSELCGEDVDSYGHLLCQSLHLVALLAEHALYATSMRPAAAIRLVRLMAPLMPHSEDLVEMMLLDAANIAFEAAAAAAAEDSALRAAVRPASLNHGEGVADITSPSRAACQPCVPSANRPSDNTGRSPLTGITPARSVCSLRSSGARGTSILSEMLSLTLLGTSSGTPYSASAPLLLHQVCRAPANGVSSMLLDDASSGALTKRMEDRDGGHGGALPSAVLLALEVLCGVIMHGRRLAASFEPTVNKLLVGLIRLASRDSPLVSQVAHRSHCRSTVSCAASNDAYDVFGTAGRDGMSLASTNISVQIFSRVQAALAAAARAGVAVTPVSDADGTDPCMLYVAAVAATLRSCVECDMDDKNIRSITECGLSVDGVSDGKAGGARTQTPLPPASPGLRCSLSNCVRWQHARALPGHLLNDTAPYAGGGGAIGISRGRLQLRSTSLGSGQVAPIETGDQNVAFILAAPPVESLISGLGQALENMDWGGKPHGTGVENRGKDAPHPGSQQAQRRDRGRRLDEHITVLAELLVLAAFGDDCVATCQQGSRCSERTLSCQQMQQLSQQKFTDAEAEAVLQLRMQVLAALIAILARAPEAIALVVLRAAAPLLPQPLQEQRQRQLGKGLPEVVPPETDAVRCISKDEFGMGAAAAIGDRRVEGITTVGAASDILFPPNMLRRQTAYDEVVADDNNLLAAQSAVHEAVSLALLYRTRDDLVHATQDQMQTMLMGTDALAGPVCRQFDGHGNTVVRDADGGAGEAHMTATCANGGQRAVSTALAALLACHGALQDKLQQLAAAMVTPQGPLVESTVQEHKRLAAQTVAPGTGVTTPALIDQSVGMSAGVHPNSSFLGGTAVASILPLGDSGAKLASTQTAGSRDATKSAGAGKGSGFFVVRRLQAPAAPDATAAVAVASNQRHGGTPAPSATADRAAAPAAASMNSLLWSNKTALGHDSACDTLQSKLQHPLPPPAAVKAAIARPILNTWPVSVQVCTELLQQLLGLPAMSSLPLSPASQVQRWRLIAYGANMARRSLSSAGGLLMNLQPPVGERNTRSPGVLAEELLALGNVAINIALEAGAAQEVTPEAGGGNWNLAPASADVDTAITKASEPPGRKASGEAAGWTGTRAAGQTAPPGTAARGSFNPWQQGHQHQTPCPSPPPQVQSMGRNVAEDDAEKGGANKICGGSTVPWKGTMERAGRGCGSASDSRDVSTKKPGPAASDRMAEEPYEGQAGAQLDVQTHVDIPCTERKTTERRPRHIKMLGKLQESLLQFSRYKDVMASAFKPDSCRRSRRSCGGMDSNASRGGDSWHEGAGSESRRGGRKPCGPTRPTVHSHLLQPIQPQTNPEMSVLQRSKACTNHEAEQYLRMCASVHTCPPACILAGGHPGSHHGDDFGSNGDNCIRDEMQPGDAASEARAEALQLLATVARAAIVCLPSTCEGSPDFLQCSSETASKLTSRCSILLPLSRSGGSAAAAVAHGGAAPEDRGAPVANAIPLLQALLQRLYPPSVSGKIAREMLLDVVPHMSQLTFITLWVCEEPLAVASLCLLDEARRLLLRAHYPKPDPKKHGQQELGGRRHGLTPLAPPAQCPARVGGGELPFGGQQQQRQCKNGAVVGKVVDALVTLAAALPFCSSEGEPRYRQLFAAIAYSCSQMLLCPAGPGGGTNFSGKTARLLARLACRGALAVELLDLASEVLLGLSRAGRCPRLPCNGGGGVGQSGGRRGKSQGDQSICPYIHRAAARFARNNVLLAHARRGDCGFEASTAHVVAPWLTGSSTLQIAHVLLELSSAAVPRVQDAAVVMVTTGTYAPKMAGEELPASVATALTCCLQACGLLLNPPRAAISAAPVSVVTQPANCIWSTPVMGRAHAEAEAEEEKRRRLLVLAVRRLQTVAKCAAACMYVIKRRLSAALAATTAGVPAAAAPAPSATGRSVENDPLGNGPLCVVLSLWRYHSKDVAAVTEQLSAFPSRSLQRHSCDLHRLASAWKSAWHRLVLDVQGAPPPQEPGLFSDLVQALYKAWVRVCERATTCKRGKQLLSPPSPPDPSSHGAEPPLQPVPLCGSGRRAGTADISEPRGACHTSEGVARDIALRREKLSPNQQRQQGRPRPASAVKGVGNDEEIPYEPLLVILGYSSSEESSEEVDHDSSEVDVEREDDSANTSDDDDADRWDGDEADDEDRRGKVDGGDNTDVGSFHDKFNVADTSQRRNLQQEKHQQQSPLPPLPPQQQQKQQTHGKRRSMLVSSLRSVPAVPSAGNARLGMTERPLAAMTTDTGLDLPPALPPRTTPSVDVNVYIAAGKRRRITPAALVTTAKANCNKAMTTISVDPIHHAGAVQKQSVSAGATADAVNPSTTMAAATIESRHKRRSKTSVSEATAPVDEDADGNAATRGTGVPSAPAMDTKRRRRKHDSARRATQEEAGKRSSARRRRKKTRQRSSRNPFIAACLKETENRSSDTDGGWSDLEDFLVCQPERDYSAFLSKKHYYAADEDSEKDWS